MPKKFFDIIPPKETNPFLKELESKIKSDARKISKKEIKKLSDESFELKENNNLEKKKSSKLFLKLGFLFLFIIVLAGAAGLLAFSKTEVKIWPKTEIMTLQETIIIDSGVSQADFIKKTIPGKIIQEKKTGSQEFSATGKELKEEKAAGAIRVYNAYSTSPQTLVATTRFVSAEGKLFRTIRAVSVPGGTYESGKLVPGYVDVEVQAAEAGDSYNIGASTFSIPGFAGTAKYTAFYGKSFVAMAGGFRGEVAKVADGDLESARIALREKLEKESEDLLKNMVPEDYVLLDGVVTQKVSEKEVPVSAGAEVQLFDLQLEVESEGLIFKRTDINNFAKNLIGLNLPQDKKYQEESLEIDFSEAERDEGKITVNLKISFKSYQNIDFAELKKAISGRTTQEVNTFLADHPQISRTEMKRFSLTSLMRKMPEDIDKIKITLKLD